MPTLIRKSSSKCVNSTLTYRCFRQIRKKTLLQKGYPRGVLSNYINNVLNWQKNKSAEPITTVPKKDIFLVLPFLGSQSEVLARRVKSCVSKFYGHLNLRVILNNTCRVKFFLPYKNCFSRSQRSKVVYKASYWDCDSFYVGNLLWLFHR